MIGPAYKFTPIDRIGTYDDDDSYEPQEGMEYEEEDGAYEVEDYLDSNHANQLPSSSGERNRGKNGNGNEVWCVFDMPLLFSKTICDWAVGINV